MTATKDAADCYLTALRLLSGRDYTCRGLMLKLQRRRFDNDAIGAAIARLKADGYLQDRQYAERFAAAARENGRFAGYRLRQELIRRGVTAELADEVLRADGTARADEGELVMGLLRRRYPAFDPQSAGDRERRRVAAFLQRRGYGHDTVRDVLGRRDSWPSVRRDDEGGSDEA